METHQTNQFSLMAIIVGPLNSLVLVIRKFGFQKLHPFLKSKVRNPKFGLKSTFHVQGMNITQIKKPPNFCVPKILDKTLIKTLVTYKCYQEVVSTFQHLLRIALAFYHQELILISFRVRFKSIDFSCGLIQTDFEIFFTTMSFSWK